MTVKLDVDHLPLLVKLLGQLQAEPNPVRQQQALELLTVQWALRMGRKKAALMVADGMHKHIRQLIEQTYRDVLAS